MKSPVSRRTFDVHEYHRMLEAGILGEDDRIELIEGEMTEMSPIGSRHSACVDRLTRAMIMILGAEYIVRVQSPIRLDDLSEPEPDLSILKHRDDFYADHHPTPEDVLLLIEVSDTSLEYDRTVKLPLYAGHAVAEVWIVDLEERAVEVYTEPSGNRYSSLSTKRAGESIESIAVTSLAVAVSETLA